MAMTSGGRGAWWLAALGALLGCGGAPEGGPHHVEVGEAEVIGALVVRAAGVPARPGGPCEVEVRRVRGPVFNCRLRILCGGEVVYGLPDAGFNRCRVDERRVLYARDSAGTRADGDPQMTFDRAQGRVVVTDRDPDVELVLALETSGVPGAPPGDATPEPPPGYGPGPGAPP